MTCIGVLNSITRLLQTRKKNSLGIDCPRPCQAEQLWDQVKDDSIEGLSRNCKDCDEDGKVVPGTLSDSTLRISLKLIAMRSHQSRKGILSLFARNSKQHQLKELISRLADFRIKEARKHCTEHGPGIAALADAIHGFFRSETKVERFLRFMTSDVISQDTAYGTSRVKLDSGGELLVPKQIRKLIPDRNIDQYLKICEETDFKPAIPRTL